MMEALSAAVKERAKFLMTSERVEEVAFGKHLLDVAAAIDALEQIDDGTAREGSALPYIEKVVPGAALFATSAERAMKATMDLVNALREMQTFGANIAKFGDLTKPLGGTKTL